MNQTKMIELQLFHIHMRLCIAQRRIRSYWSVCHNCLYEYHNHRKSYLNQGDNYNYDNYVSPISYELSLKCFFVSSNDEGSKRFLLWRLFKYFDSYFLVSLIKSKTISSIFSFNLSHVVHQFESASLDQMIEKVQLKLCSILNKFVVKFKEIFNRHF